MQLPKITGFEKNANSQCVNINECLQDRCNLASSTCIDKIGDFECRCRTGFRIFFGKSSDFSVFDDFRRNDRMLGNVCTNINECQEGGHNCDVNAECIDTVGSFSCQCIRGYHGSGVEAGILQFCRHL